jgi:DNA-damage-inducible protein D
MPKNALPNEPDRHTMERLESAKRLTETGAPYWLAREIHPILGYPDWRNFEPSVKRAENALRTNGQDPSHHIVETQKMMERGGGAQTGGRDYFLSRAAAYLIAMNGDPSKPEVAAAQIYFAARTRQMELEEQRSQDVKRLELREQVSQSHKRVSSAAKSAGVRNHMQGIFHDAGSQGLYGLSRAEVKRRKGLKESDSLYDHADPLELSANEFRNNLAADVIGREGIKKEQTAIDRNKAVGREVREAMKKSGARMPEDLPLAPEPISVVARRVRAEEKARLSKPPTT